MEVSLPITALASSSDTLLIGVGSTLYVYTPSIGGVASCSAAAGPSKPSNPPALIRNLAISPDGHAVSLADDKSLRVYSLSPRPTILSTRTTLKRGSDLCWIASGELVLSDKIGDVYLYPRDPLPLPPPSDLPEDEGKQRKQVHVVADRSLNPDASLLLGHVSITTSHLVTPDYKYLITADRDEHIRISHFPKSCVISHYLFGSEGFVSALHIPPRRPSVLLSAGGESTLRIWDWQGGKQVGGVEIWEAMLPYRAVRSHMRRTRGKRRKLDSDASADAEGEGSERGVEDEMATFHRAPDGFQLPSGEGICVKKIQSTEVDGRVVVLLFSEGCRAIHSFVLPSDLSLPTSLSTLALPHPVLDFAIIPSSNEILISLDTAWGVLKSNAEGMTHGHTKISKSLSPEDAAEMSKSLVVAQISSDGSLAVQQDHPLLATLHPSLSESRVLPETLSALSLYPLLSLLPRWEGQEEDDELAGPSATASETASLANEAMGQKTYTREELEGMNVKMLGRLRAKGVDVGDLIYKKEKRYKAEKEEKAKAKAAGKAAKPQAEAQDVDS